MKEKTKKIEEIMEEIKKRKNKLRNNILNSHSNYVYAKLREEMEFYHDYDLWSATPWRP